MEHLLAFAAGAVIGVIILVVCFVIDHNRSLGDDF